MVPAPPGTSGCSAGRAPAAARPSTGAPRRVVSREPDADASGDTKVCRWVGEVFGFKMFEWIVDGLNQHGVTIDEKRSDTPTNVD